MLCIAHTHTPLTVLLLRINWQWLIFVVPLFLLSISCKSSTAVFCLSPHTHQCVTLSFCVGALSLSSHLNSLGHEEDSSESVGRSVSQQLFSAWHLLLPLSLHTMLHFDLIGHLSFSSSIDLVVVGGRRGTMSSGTSPLSVCLCLCSTSPVLSLCQWQLINRPITGWLFSELRRR